MTTLPQLPPRPVDGHKGDFGRVLVVAGSRGMIGAAELCSRAVLKTGSGLVLAVTPEECYPILAAKLTCGMTMPAPQTPTGGFALGAWRQIAETAEGFDVIALGPGFGRHPSTQALAVRLIEEIDRPMVIDADALFAIATELGHLNLAGAIITPHHGEMARLTGKTTAEVQESREVIASKVAKVTGAVVVLKGHGTVIADGSRVAINPTGNPGMATAGAGDVLTGMIAALVGQKMELFDAARLGAYRHGRAGDIAAARIGQLSVTAADILDVFSGPVPEV